MSGRLKVFFDKTIMYCQVKLQKNRCKSVRTQQKRKKGRQKTNCFGEPSHIHENIASEIHQW